MDLNEFLQGLRVLAHVATVLLVAGYKPDESSAHRIGISAFAILLAGGSSCLAVSTVLSWHQWLAMPDVGHVVITAMMGALLIPLAAGRGNVAVLFPRRPWSHRP